MHTTLRSSTITETEWFVMKSGLPPIHPGEFLKEILEDRGISQAQFARAIGVAPMRISHIVKGARPVSAELALLFGRALGQSPQYWLNLQAAYDLKIAERSIRAQLKAVTELESA
jgi:addiction module HigA family antidote